MADEYKVLQDKIDKIGGFRFTIKGWAVTAVVAATAAVSATKSLMAAFVVSGGLAILVLFFFRFEVEQVRLSRLFGLLARNIEQAFEDMESGTRVRLFSSPLIARQIVEESLSRKQLIRFSWWMAWRYLGTRYAPARKAWRNRLSEGWSVWKSAHLSFYLFLLLFAFVPVAARYRTVFVYMRVTWFYLNPAPPPAPAPPQPSPEM